MTSPFSPKVISSTCIFKLAKTEYKSRVKKYNGKNKI